MFAFIKINKKKKYITFSNTGKVAVKWTGNSRLLCQFFLTKNYSFTCLTAPEAMKLGTFTSKSDVYSFGVVVWEIFTHGDSPWGWLSNNDAFAEVTAGNVLPQPPNCEKTYYNLMLK